MLAFLALFLLLFAPATFFLLSFGLVVDGVGIAELLKETYEVLITFGLVFDGVGIAEL